ncbi:MAG TPA: CotH kinase family protein [Polyangiaceae bacterium]|nr:CotH kinase family protein [Polyangiaceae bacterium]
MKHYLRPFSFAVLAVCSCNSSSPSNPAPAPTQQDDTIAKVIAEVGGCLSKKCGPANEEFFSNEKYAKVSITFSQADIQALEDAKDWQDLAWNKWKSQCGNAEWIPVNMVYDPGDGGKTWELNKVAMRMRGSKSRGSNPLGGFKVDYNEFLPKEVDRRFADMNRLDLLSNEKDPTDILQCLAYKLERDFGLNAPKCNHVQVTIDGQIYGMMESIETAKDKRYLERHFANPEGPLFGASTGKAVCGYPSSQADFVYKGDAFNEDYKKTYEIERGTEDDAAKYLFPMVKCMDSVETPNDEDFEACIKEWIDVDEWLKLIAAESLMPAAETFVGARRNAYLYFEPNDFAPHGGYMHIWGWDYDTAFQRQPCYPAPASVDAPICGDPFKDVTAWYGPRGTRSKAVVRLTTVFKKRYCELMNEFLEKIYEPEKVTQMANVIKPGMANDPVMAAQGWDWQTEVQGMHDFMVKRRAAMKAVVASMCSGDAPITGVAGAPGVAGSPGGVAGGPSQRAVLSSNGGAGGAKSN